MNKLQNIIEFQGVLGDYRPSEEVIALANKVNLVLLAGISASGRNTIIQELIKTGRYHHLVSDTTRQPRTNNGITEASGSEYIFRTEEDFLQRLKNGKYLEAAIIHGQQVSGISIEELGQADKEHRFAITDIEIIGTKKVLEVVPRTQAIFMIPPEFDEWMRRLLGRGSLDQEEIKRRMVSAEKEIELALELENLKFVINEDYLQTAKEIDKLALGLQRDSKKIESIKETSWKLLNRIKGELYS